jgi:hypothetical protein
MKQAQWTGAVLVLAVMVFVITFAMNYLGNTATDSGAKGVDDGEENLELTFDLPQYPPGKAPLEAEGQSPGWHDFWFVNWNEKPVRFGLGKKFCKCSSLELFLMPSEWVERRGVLAAGQSALGAWEGAGMARLTGAAASEIADPVLRNLQEDQKPEPVEFTEQTDTASIPAHGIGWVRLKWTGERNSAGENTSMWANVWTTNRTAGPGTTLSVRMRVLGHVRVASGDREKNLGGRTLQDLPFTTKVLCWSSTRHNFAVQAELVKLRNLLGPDPFMVGSPEPLTPAECSQLEQDLRLAAEKDKTNETDLGRVLAGYRIPVTIRNRVGETKTALDLGPFHRQLEIRMLGDDRDPVSITLTGRIEGEVAIGGDMDKGRIRFGRFERNKGSKTQTINLWTEPGVKLELDLRRTADFLEVRWADKPETASDGRLLWHLEATVRPNQVLGDFPRTDDPTYRDCAVYLKTVGDRPQTVRIPVEGIAYVR